MNSAAKACHEKCIRAMPVQLHQRRNLCSLRFRGGLRRSRIIVMHAVVIVCYWWASFFLNLTELSRFGEPLAANRTALYGNFMSGGLATTRIRIPRWRVIVRISRHDWRREGRSYI